MVDYKIKKKKNKHNATHPKGTHLLFQKLSVYPSDTKYKRKQN